MKKITNFLIILSLFLVPVMVFAADTNGDGYDDTTGAYIGGSGSGTGAGILDFGDQSQLAKDLNKYQLVKTKSLTQMLDLVANYVVGILVIMAIFYILWAAYTFVTSAGAEEKVSEARKRIMFAAIGIIVALIAKGIVALVVSVTTAGTTG